MSNFNQRSEALSSVEVLARFQAAIVGGSSVILGSVGLPVRNAATQDAITLLGRAGGTSSFQCKLTPAVLSATQTVTFPDSSFTVAGLQIAQTFTANQTVSSATDAQVVTIAGGVVQGTFSAVTASSVVRLTGYKSSGVSLALAVADSVGTYDQLTLTGANSSSAVATFNSAVPSTSTTTGAVVIPNGGLGVGGNLTAGTARVIGQAAFGSVANGGATSGTTCFRAGTDVNGDVFCAWNKSTLATDEKVWDCLQNASSLYFRCINDAYTVGNPWLTVVRSGATPIQAAFAAPVTTNQGFTTTGINNQIIQATTTGPGNFSVLRLTNTGASGRTYDFDCCGNTTPYPGAIILYDGTSGGVLRFSVGPTGGFYIGSTYTDPGQGNLTVQNAIRSVSPTAGIGYGTGAGGTVTQLTSKSTGVTLNAVSGTITMNGAALASATNVAFTFTNSAIAATDKVEVDHDSAGTLCAYNICVTPAAGSATVTVRNMTAGSLSEAIVLRFFVKKAVIS